MADNQLRQFAVADCVQCRCGEGVQYPLLCELFLNRHGSRGSNNDATRCAAKQSADITVAIGTRNKNPFADARKMIRTSINDPAN